MSVVYVFIVKFLAALLLLSLNFLKILSFLPNSLAICSDRVKMSVVGDHEWKLSNLPWKTAV